MIYKRFRVLFSAHTLAATFITHVAAIDCRDTFISFIPLLAQTPAAAPRACCAARRLSNEHEQNILSTVQRGAFAPPAGSAESTPVDG